MNYQNVYDAIITRAKNRHLEGAYVERHHIIPKCMGGSDDQENLVDLLAREHLLCHLLLLRIHPGNPYLAKAVAAMTMKNSYHTGRVTCRIYGWIRGELAKATSQQWKGVPKSEEHKRKIGEKSARPDRVAKLIEMNKTMPWSEERRRKIAEANSRRIITDEERRRLATLTLGRKATDEERAAMSERRKGKPRIISQEGLVSLKQKLTGREITWGDKISRTLKGRKPTPEQIQKSANSRRGLKQSPETIAKRLETQRRNREAKRLAILQAGQLDTAA